MFSGKSLLIYFVFVLGSVYIPSPGAAAVPQKMNFQGRLTDISGVSITGSESILFSIWDAVTSGNSLWSETQTVQISSGIYNVSLGDVAAISSTVFSAADRWIEVKVGSDSPMTPRIKLQTVPYAHIASHSNFSTGNSLFIIKPQNSSLVNSDVLQDDPHLQLNMEANTSYVFEIIMFFDRNPCTSGGGNFKGIKYSLRGPAGVNQIHAGVNYWGVNFSSGKGYLTALSQTGSFTAGCSTGGQLVLEVKGSISNGVNAGSLVLQWAQTTVDPDTFTLLAGSYLKATKIP